MPSLVVVYQRVVSNPEGWHAEWYRDGCSDKECRKEQPIEQITYMTNIAKTNSTALNNADSNSDRDLLRIASVSTALAFGAVLASLEALYRNTSGFAFHISLRTLAAFVIGGAVGLVYWKIVTLGATGRASKLLRPASFLLLLAGVGAFLYPLRFLSKERLIEVFQGLATVAVALSLVGYILWRIKGFLEQDAAQTGIGSTNG
jgi:hypothetical protein